MQKVSWMFFLSFLITALGQPAWLPFLGPVSSCLGFALFWKSLLLILKAKRRWLIATFWFMAIQLFQLSWMATPKYMGPFIIPFYLFLTFALGAQFGFLSSLVRSHLSWSHCFAIAGGWVLCEWARLFFLCGYSWNPVGLSLSCSLYSLQLASVWGVFGLSFWVILTNLAFLKSKKIWAGMALLPYLFGYVYVSWIEKQKEGGESLRVALVQTNLLPEEKELDPSFSDAYIPPKEQWQEILKSLEQVSAVDLIVLPEAALPLGAHRAIYDLDAIYSLFPKEVFPPLRRPYAIFFEGKWKISNAFLVQALANQKKAHVITGLDDRDFKGKYNAAFHFQPRNLPYTRYEKQILVPIGEYIPLSGMKWFSRWIASQFKIYGSFDAGKEGKVFFATAPIGISICLEETFPHLIRTLRQKGAKVLVSVSNDAYFPKTKLEDQHFHHGKIRAVENGVSLLRSCNAGVTGAVDLTGKTIGSIRSQRQTHVLTLDVPLFSKKTLYTFWGDLGILIPSLLFFSFFLKKSFSLSHIPSPHFKKKLP